MPIVVLITLTPKPGQSAALHRLVGEAMEHNRTEPGNLFTILLRGRESPEDTVLFEIFADEAAIDAHRVAAHTLADGPAIHALLAAPLRAQYFDCQDVSDFRRSIGRINP